MPEPKFHMPTRLAFDADTALRIGAAHDVPIVFTYHTMYERYTHYLPG